MGRRRKKVVPTRTTVVVVQDKSGSMSSRRAATISGFNEYLGKLQQEAEDGAQVQMTLTQFDTYVKNVFTSRPLEDIRELRDRDYIPGGMTALYDAVGRAVRATELSVRKDDRVLVIIMTDGDENSSTEYQYKTILDLLSRKRAEGWEFIFLGAGEEAWNTGQLLGFTQVNSVNYGTSEAATMDSFGEVAFASMNVLRGATAQSYLASSPIKKRLEDESGYTVKIQTDLNRADKHKNTVKTPT